MKIQKRLQWVAVLGALFAPFASADIAGVQFSADMVSRGPNDQVTTGKMYVGTSRIRIEMAQQGRNVVRINDQDSQTEWVLLPEQKTYLERTMPRGGDAHAAIKPPSAETNPCEGLEGLTCRRVGAEDVAGRSAIKWEMTVMRDGKTLTGAQWIDVERGLPLRYQMPNGQSMELKMLGAESIGGRSVEKWQMTTVAPNQQPVETFQWYDPELKLSVREEFPGGFVRELDNIQIGQQPDELFRVPEGYSKVDAPPPAAKQ